MLYFHKALHLFSKVGVLIYQATVTVCKQELNCKVILYKANKIDLEITSGKKLQYHVIDKNIIFQVLAALSYGRGQRMFSENDQVVNI